MSNEFDIEKAKAGEPVELMLDPEWVPVHFVGTEASGHPVVQRRGFDPVFTVSSLRLRMAPKTVKVRYRLYKMCDSAQPGVSMICDGPGWVAPEEIEKRSWFRGWIHADWQEVEIPQ